MEFAHVPVQRLERNQRIKDMDQPVKDALPPSAIRIVENIRERCE